MTRQEKHKLTAHIVTDIGEHLADLTHDDADEMLDSIIESLQTQRTRVMILPDDVPELDELDRPELTLAERNR